MAAHLFVQSCKRYQYGSRDWAVATARTFDTLRLPECEEVRRINMIAVINC